MSRLSLLLVLGIAGCSPSNGITIQGSGATFPSILFKRWFLEYYRQHPEVRVNYLPIGSGAGIRQFEAGLVHFAASDIALTDSEMQRIAATTGRVRQFPIAAGCIVFAYHLPELATELRLCRATYLRIMAGEIRRWDDPRIIKDNPGAVLPAREIILVCRAESSGTTEALTLHLDAVAREMGETWTAGVGKSIRWPKSISAPGNDGVTSLIQLTPGAIGYVEYGYAQLAGLKWAVLENAAGHFIAANPESGSFALQEMGASIDHSRSYCLPRDARAYPIVAWSWFIIHDHDPNPRRHQEVIRVLRFAISGAQQAVAHELGYLGLPSSLIRQIHSELDVMEQDSFE